MRVIIIVSMVIPGQLYEQLFSSVDAFRIDNKQGSRGRLRQQLTLTTCVTSNLVFLLHLC